MTSNQRVGLALIFGFLLAIAFSLLNGQDLLFALKAGFIFAIIVGIVVALLSWGMDIAILKGYPGWAGFLLVLVLNILGLFILLLLPHKPIPDNNLSGREHD